VRLVPLTGQYPFGFQSPAPSQNPGTATGHVDFPIDAILNQVPGTMTGADQIPHADLVSRLWIAPRRKVQVHQPPSGPDQAEGAASLKHEILGHAPIERAHL
jgi:hypothetical protein